MQIECHFMFFVFEIIRNIYESPFLYLSANENFRFLPLTLFIRIAEYSGRVFVRSCERILEYSGARVFVDVNGFRNIPGARVFVHVDGSRNIPGSVHMNELVWADPGIFRVLLCSFMWTDPGIFRARVLHR